LPFDLDLYRQGASSYITYAEIDAEIGKDEAAEKPQKFKYVNSNKLEESVYIYLDSVVSKSGAPLSYVIRKDLEAGTNWDELDRKVQEIHTAPLQGFIFDIDSKRVLTLLKELCLDTEAETWFRNIKCGRAAMKALQLHYDGPDESKRRKEEARSKIKNVYYKHEGVICTYVKLCTYHDLYGITLLFTHTCEYYQTRLDLDLYIYL